MEKVVLKAQLREKSTKGAVNSLRRNGRVPAVYYGKKSDPVLIDVMETAINPLVFTAETHFISLQLDGQDERECIIKDVQFDPVTDKVIHFDLIGLVRGELVTLEVPIQYHGSAIGVKEGGVLMQVLHKLDISCLPKDMPQHLDVDISKLKLGDAIHAGDLKYDNITILTAPETVIVHVTHPRAEKAAGEEGAEGPTEPEVIGKGKEEE